MPNLTLRERAEARLRESGKEKKRAMEDPQRLLHELEVHQIELQMQNEELRRSRDEAETAVDRYAELFDFAPLGYAVLERDGMIREINHAGAKLAGMARSHLVGTPFSLLIAARDLAKFHSLLERANSERKESCDVALLRRSQTPDFRPSKRREDDRRIVRFTATVLQRESSALMLAFEDITDEAEREDRLARTEAELRDSNRRKDEFLAVLSHELRNPLAPIRNSLYVLEKAPPGTEQANNAKRIMDRQVTHLTRLIDDLLDITRIARGKIQIQKNLVEFGDVVRRALEDHRPAFEAGGIELVEDLEPSPAWVNADGTRLVQTVSNLLCNAEKFTPRGGRVTVSVRRTGSQVVLRIQDTGIGIAPEVREHLFEPFAQGPQTMDRTHGGLGLGLAMVKGLVELHGGTVRIDSPGPGRGTEATVELPQHTAPAETIPPKEDPLTASRRVLVIEDNPDAAESLKEALELGGHAVEVAHDGPSALELARQFQPEIAICDIGLPKMDGYAVARAFRAEPNLSDVYLVALSGYAQPEDRRRAKEASFDEHVAKPPRLETLEKLLADFAQRRGKPAPSGILH